MIVIKNKEIAKLFNCSPATATRKMQLFRDAHNRKKHTPIRWEEFAAFYELPLNTFK